jgi:hypothetical protein
VFYRPGLDGAGKNFVCVQQNAGQNHNIKIVNKLFNNAKKPNIRDQQQHTQILLTRKPKAEQLMIISATIQSQNIYLTRLLKD